MRGINYRVSQSLDRVKPLLVCGNEDNIGLFHFNHLQINKFPKYGSYCITGF